MVDLRLNAHKGLTIPHVPSLEAGSESCPVFCIAVFGCVVLGQSAFTCMRNVLHDFCIGFLLMGNNRHCTFPFRTNWSVRSFVFLWTEAGAAPDVVLPDPGQSICEWIVSFTPQNYRSLRANLLAINAGFWDGRINLSNKTFRR